MFNSRYKIKKLGEILISLESGCRPKGGVRHIFNGIPSIGAEHLNNKGGFNFINQKFIPIEFYKKLKRGIIKRNDILLVKDGATTGKVSFVNENFPFKEAAVNEHIFILRANPVYVLPKFLFRFLFSQNGQNQIIKTFHGSAQGGINSNFVNYVKIPLPPLSVQKQIVEKIEKLFSKIDEAEKLLKESLDASSNLFNSALQKVFKRGEKEGWEIRKLGELLDYEQPTKYLINSPDYSDKYNTPVLTAGKTFVLGKTNEKDGIFPKEKLPVIIFDDFTTASKFVDFSFKVKSSAMKILHAKKDLVDVKFIFYKMQTINFPVVQHKRYWISEYSKIEIFLPPLSEQKKIVEYLDGLRKKVEELKRLQEEQLKSLEELRKSILKKAFEGNINSF